MKEHLSQPQTYTGTSLSEVIVEGIEDKQGEDIVSLDLRNIRDAAADWFIICHGDSTTQVKAIADHVDGKVKVTTGETPWHREGMKNLEWVLLDYVDVVVHVFLREKREHYDLEDLWSDGVATRH